MKTIQHKFVEYIPESLEDGVLYITMEYRTAVHKCICGCGNKVVTPISPTFWTLSFDGRGVTLHPSIGNWNFPCRSHYWIKGSTIQMAQPWKESKPIVSQRPIEQVDIQPQPKGDEGQKQIKTNKNGWLKRLRNNVLKYLGWS